FTVALGAPRALPLSLHDALPIARESQLRAKVCSREVAAVRSYKPWNPLDSVGVRIRTPDWLTGDAGGSDIAPPCEGRTGSRFQRTGVDGSDREGRTGADDGARYRTGAGRHRGAAFRPPDAVELTAAERAARQPHDAGRHRTPDARHEGE